MSETVPKAAPRESAGQRQARLRERSARQREALQGHWRRVEPTLDRIDSAVARLRRLAEHPLTLALGAVAATAFVASRRGRRMLGGVRLGWRMATRGATLLSFWRALHARGTSRSRTPARHQ